MIRQRGVLAVGGAIAVLALIGALVAANWAPTIPADAGSTEVGRATLATGGASSSLHGGECLDRVTRPGGWMDLCWQADRVPDGDATKDYYALRVYGSISGEPGGIRWSVVSADLDGQVADSVFDAWPDGTFEGPCTERTVNLPIRGTFSTQATICGRTVGYSTGSAWSHRVAWTCVGCLIADRSDRELALYQYVGVLPGTLPSWTIGADFGS